ncbi:glycosyltransferase family 8 protein [Methylobacterium nigriterrae]|uniref:glycosyltransferase family 8 protein n=1 Tax=Methylobacterium nigriterrae TaxID=3127512 RepID=UPI003013EA0A
MSTTLAAPSLDRPADLICILFCVDTAYLGQAGVALSSILASNPHSAFEVYIAGFDCDPKASEAIFEGVTAKHPSCRVIYKDFDAGLFAAFPVTRHISRSAYTRILAGQFVDPRHTRLLYLDADIVVRSDLRELWATPLDRYVVGAVQDHFVLDREAIGFRSDEPYFNSGMLLINMPAWRAADCEARLLTYLAEHGQKLQFADQDALNVVLRGQVRFLDLGWNFQPRCADVPASFLGLSPATYATLRANPQLIHYTTSVKPWNAPHRVHYSHHFFEAARVAGLERFFDAPNVADLPDWLSAVKTWLRWHFPSVFRMIRRVLKPESAAMMYRARGAAKETTT